MSELTDEAAVAGLARKRAVAGILTFDERALPVVAAVAEDLSLPGPGRETAHLLSHKVALRRQLAEHGVPQPEFAAARTLHEGRTAMQTVGLPAVLEPADSEGLAGRFVLRYEDELETHLHVALAESPTHEAIVERYDDAPELVAVAVARSGHVVPLAVCDRRRPSETTLGTSLLDVYPTTLFGDALASVEDVVARTIHALGLRDGIAVVRLVLSDEGPPRLIGVAGCAADAGLRRLAVHALGVDLIAIALRLAVGEDVPDEAVTPRFRRPSAIQHLTAEPGPLPTGTVRRVGSLEKVLAFPGVLEADTELAVGETIDPVRLDGEGHGYVIATGDTNLEARDRAGAAARLVDVEVW